MNNRIRMIIIALLVLVVGSIVFLKQKSIASSNQEMPGEKETVSQALPKLLDLGADKCIPCKMMMPILDELSESHKDKFEVVFIDVWKNPEAAQPYQIKLIPTQIFFDGDGNELFRHEGFFSKEEILSKWQELGVDIKLN